MPLKLMYITKDPEVAKICEKTGVDRIFLDFEFIGKSLRQGGMDTVQLHHTPEDVKGIREVITKAEILVRVNPIHETGSYMGIEHDSSEDEINAVIDAGADWVMLPYFKTAEEVQTFINLVNGRAKTMLLLETKEAAGVLDDILKIKGIDNIHIGLNDLSLSMKTGFMFRILADGTVASIVQKIKSAGIPFGIGGIAAVGAGLLPAEYIIGEHYRLGSSGAILSRSFCNTSVITDYEEIEQIFTKGIKDIRALEADLAEKVRTNDTAFFEENSRQLMLGVEKVEAVIAAKKK